MAKSKSPLDRLVFRRDEKGNLIEKQVSLENGDKVFLIPLTIGEVMRLSVSTEEIIISHLLTNNVKSPKFSNDEAKLVVPEYVKLFVNKIYDISNVNADKKNRHKDEDAFGKRLRESRRDKLEFDSIYFLHGLGYNLFNINNLTYAEVNELVAAHNRDIDKKNIANKTASKK